MSTTAESDIQAFMKRFQAILVVGAVGVLVPLAVLIYFLDRRLDTFEDNLRTPGEVAEAGGQEGEEVHIDFVQGQTLYVPAYSHIYSKDNRPNLLTVTLSLRNTDPDNEIVIRSVRYFDTEGNELRKLLDSPVRLSKMATREFVIARDDATGGSGANFLVEWGSGVPVTEPIVETVMIDMRGQQSISFARSGKVIKEIVPGEPAE